MPTDRLLLFRSLTLKLRKANLCLSSCNCKEKVYDVTIRKPRRTFVDKVRILVKGGSGGMGYQSTGGLGGNGGNIIFESREGASLAQFGVQYSKRITGISGQNCRKGKLSGDYGAAKKFYVPPGTMVSCTEAGLLADFDKSRQHFVVAKGGAGGRHYNSFQGQQGEKRLLVLELKSIADIGLVGYPNAGKSTLLSNISKARPKIGHYPFTTIRPTVGTIFYDDKRQITVADLPGLIEDAHQNKGMGHRFLRHVERTKCLLMLVDVNGFQLKQGAPFRTPLHTLCHLLKELYLYEGSLLSLPTMVALNKVDNDTCQPLFDSAKNSILTVTEDIVYKILQDPSTVPPVYEKVRQICRNEEGSIIKTSTKFGIGLDSLRDAIYKQMFPSNEVIRFQENDDGNNEGNDFLGITVSS